MSNFVELLITEVENRPILWNRRLKDYKNRVLAEREWQRVAQALQKDKYKCKLKWKNLRDQFHRECKRIRNLLSVDLGTPPPESCNVRWAHFEQMKFLKIFADPPLTERNFNVESIKEESIDIPEDTPSQDSNTMLEEDDTPPTSIALSRPEESLEKIEGPPLPELEKTEGPPLSEFEKFEEPSLSEFEKQYIELENKKMQFLMENSMPSTSHQNSRDDEDMLFVKSLVPFIKNLTPLRKLIVRNKIHEVLIAEMQNAENGLSNCT